jgi:hypothetical protein
LKRKSGLIQKIENRLRKEYAFLAKKSKKIQNFCCNEDGKMLKLLVVGSRN